MTLHDTSDNMGQPTTAQSLGPPIADPASPSMSIATPVLPGSMPSLGQALNNSVRSVEAPHGGTNSEGDVKPASAAMSSTSSTSNIASFFRNLSLSNVGPNKPVASGSASGDRGHAGSVSISAAHRTPNAATDSSNLRLSTTMSQPQRSAGETSSLASTSSREVITDSLSAASSNISPATPTAPNLSGGSQIKRGFSNSSAAKRMRKLSSPIPSFLSGNATKDGGSAPSPLSARPVSGEGFQNASDVGTPRQSVYRDKEDHFRTPTQTQPGSPIAGPAPRMNSNNQTTAQAGLISSSLGFLSSMTSFDKLPSMMSLPGLSIISGSGDKTAFPRGEDGSTEAPGDDVDLRIEEFTQGAGLAANDSMKDDNTDGRLQGRDNGDVVAGPMDIDSDFLPDGPSRATTSTTLGSTTSHSVDSHHGQSQTHSELTYGSTSSISLHDPSTAMDQGYSRLPTAEQSHNSILDPLTYLALSRRNSEAEAKRVEREREVRGRQLDLLERLQERAEHPQLAYMQGYLHGQESERRITPSAPKPSTGDALRSPVAVQQAELGRGTAPALAASPASAKSEKPTPPTTADSGKSNRRKSLLGRLGFSPSNKRSSSPSFQQRTGSAPAVPPIPAVHLPHSNSVSSFGSSLAPPSSPGSFAAIANATPGSAQALASSEKDLVAADGVPSITKPEYIQQDEVSLASPKTADFAPTSKKTRYIKTKIRNKSRRDFGHLFLAQELQTASIEKTDSPKKQSPSPPEPANGKDRLKPSPSVKQSKNKPENKSGQATWALRFSADGNYLASAGQDGIIRVWQVISGSEEREKVIQAMSVATHGSAANTEGGGVTDGSLGRDIVEVVPSKPMSKQEKRNSRISVASASTHGYGNGSTIYEAALQETSASSKSGIYAPVFAHKPLHEWKGHTSDVLDLSWSKNNFLLSSSMDKTVRLWHVTRTDCLCAFQHPDFVTSIAFHPKDDRYFLSGSLDAKLRLWSIPEKKLHCWTQLPELITSVAYTSDGKVAIAGTFVGLCLFFDVRDLSFLGKLHSKSSRGKNAKGRKITSIVSLPKGEPSEPERILITSNDSRARLWDISAICGLSGEQKQGQQPRLLSERHIEAKYKGHENTSSQIKATFSDDGRYVVSGSEDRQCYIWLSGLLDFPQPFSQSSKKGADKSPGLEFFNPAAVAEACCCPFQHASHGIVTCAVMAPTETRTTLARGGDPLYGDHDDNPMEGRAKLQRSVSQASSTPSSSNGHAKRSSILGSPSARSDDSGVASATASTSSGMIIVTADDSSGLIRVFRNNAVFSILGATAKNVPSIASSGRENVFVSGGFPGRRASQISKVSRSTNRVRGSFERQARGGGTQLEEEESAA